MNTGTGTRILALSLLASLLVAASPGTARAWTGVEYGQNLDGAYGDEVVFYDATTISVFFPLTGVTQTYNVSGYDGTPVFADLYGSTSRGKSIVVLYPARGRLDVIYPGTGSVDTHNPGTGWSKVVLAETNGVMGGGPVGTTGLEIHVVYPNRLTVVSYYTFAATTTTYTLPSWGWTEFEIEKDRSMDGNAGSEMLFYAPARGFVTIIRNYVNAPTSTSYSFPPSWLSHELVDLSSNPGKELYLEYSTDPSTHEALDYYTDLRYTMVF